MARVDGWTLTPHQRWISTDGRLRYSKSVNGWLVMAAQPSSAHSPNPDNLALHDAGILGQPDTGLSLRKLVVAASDITGAVASIKRDTCEYTINNAPLALYRIDNGCWKFRQWAAISNSNLWSTLSPSIGDHRFRTRRDALEALTAEYQRMRAAQ